MSDGIAPAGPVGIIMLTPTLGRTPTLWARRIMDIVWPMNTMKAATHAIDKRGGEIAEMRNYLVQVALDQKKNNKMSSLKIFWLDDDVVPASALVMQALLSHDRPVVSGVYFCKGDFGLPLIFPGGCSATSPFRPGEVFESWGYPQGLSLVDTTVYERVRDELDIGVDRNGRPAWYKNPGFGVGENGGLLLGGTEDFPFFESLSKVGIKPLVDCTSHAFGWHINLADLQGYPKAQFEQWAKGEPVIWPEKGEQKEVIWQ